MLALQPSNDDAAFAARLIDYIEQNYADSIALRDIANAFGYSACYLTHKFSRATGVPVTAWIIKRRIAAAQALLEDPAMNVARVCETVGFNDLCYFTRQFVRHVGMTPGRYRAAVISGVVDRER